MNLHLYEESVGHPLPNREGRRKPVASLRLVADTLSVDEIIAHHVTESWTRARNDTRSGRSRLEILDAILSETELGHVPLETAIERARRGFRNGAYLFFRNDEQITEPQKRLNILDDNDALFLRLFPMKGG